MLTPNPTIHPKNHWRILLIWSFIWTSGFATTNAEPEELPSEYLVKAQMLIRFLRYVEWPLDAIKGEKIVLVLVGKDPIDEYFAAFMGKPIKGYQLEIRRITKPNEDTELGECHVLFIGRGQKKAAVHLLDQARNRNILTVGEHSGFIEKEGGMVNFVAVKNRIQFEINQKGSSEEGLRIPSTILRLATRVVRKNSE